MLNPLTERIEKMKNIDRRKHYFLAVDTETAGSLDNPLVYDFGGRVIDSKGNVYEEASLVIYEIFRGERELMQTAYYSCNIPKYEVGLRDGTWKMARMMNVFLLVRQWMQEYNITEVLAYNTNFDRRALNHTMKHVTGWEYFFPRDTEFLDIWNMACSTLYQRKSYYKTAHRLGWQSESGNIRTNAQVGYAYISGTDDFTEAHTALEDVKIEAEIFMACLRARVKRADMGIVGSPWRKPQPGWNAYKEKHPLE